MTKQHPLDIPRPGNKPPVGPLRAIRYPYPGVRDGDTARVLFFMNLSGAYDGNKNAEQAYDDAVALAERYNAQSTADRIIRMMHEWMESGGVGVHFETLMPNNGDDEDETLRDAINAYLAAAEGK